MQNTTTDRFSEKQLEIDRRRAESCARYPQLWSKIVAEWSLPAREDRVWLTYSANYLFRTNNVRWAIDPLTLSWRIKSAPRVNVAKDLQRLSFVLLTHCHGDHLDLDLLSALRDLPITWVVPESLLPAVTGRAGVSHERIVIPSPLRTIELDGIQVLPFYGLHGETTPDGTTRGVPAVGYLIEVNGKRWLFPGDTRTYDAGRLPEFGPVDQLFAHLWLGRGCAWMEEPPLLDAFCTFCLDLEPGNIILTHLDELDRDASDLWDVVHAERIRAKIVARQPRLRVRIARMGESVLI